MPKFCCSKLHSISPKFTDETWLCYI